MQNFVLAGKAKTILRLIELRANKERTGKTERKENKK